MTTYREPAFRRVTPKPPPPKPPAQWCREDSTFITFEGYTANLHYWACEFGISSKTIKWRLASGWSLEDVFYTRPCYTRRQRPAIRRRTQLGLPDAALQDIRTSTDSQVACAARHGVSQQYVSQVRRKSRMTP